MLFPTYSTSLELIAAQHDHVLLDNIFPFPLRHIIPGENKAIDARYLSACTEELYSIASFLERQGEKVKTPFEINKQGWRGYGLLTRAVKDRNKAEVDRPPVKEQLSQFLQAGYTALSESRKHIFSLPAAEDVQYRHLAGMVKEMAEEYCLKKENHAPDNGADEELASSGIYLAHRGRTAIVTLDRDIESLVRGYDKLVSPKCIPTVYRLRTYT